MQPMVQGLFEVASPPNGAGQRGKVSRYDWDIITEELRRRPHRGFVALFVRSDEVVDLKARYLDITFLAYGHHVVRSAGGKETKMCNVYVRFPKLDE